MKEQMRERIDILRPLLKDQEPDVRIAAAEAIDKLEASGSIAEVIETLKTGDMGARVGAIFALGEIGGEAVLPPLVYCARRPEADIRAAAAAALGRVAAPATVPVMMALLDDTEPAVQERAITGLRNFPVSPELCGKLRCFLSMSDGVREAEAAVTLAHFKDMESLPKVRELLASPLASTRQAAATALGLMPFQ
jgi:HEAT repeat protein